MTIETATCGMCGDRVPLDVDHGKVTLEIQYMEDRNGDERYVLCMDCVNDVVGSWEEPV